MLSHGHYDHFGGLVGFLLCLVFMTAKTHQSVQHLGTTELVKAFRSYGIGAHEPVEPREEIVGSKLLSRELRYARAVPRFTGFLPVARLAEPVGSPRIPSILNPIAPCGLTRRQAEGSIEERPMWRHDTRAVMVIADGKRKFIGEAKWDKSDYVQGVA